MHLASDKRAIGYVAQEGALFPHLTAGENVGFGLPRSERKQGARIVRGARARRTRRELRGPRPRTSSPAASSGGWRSPGHSRHARGSCCSTSPSPASTPRCASRRARRCCTLCASEGTTAVLVTHDQAEALSMGREVAVLRDGRLAQRATPTALYRDPGRSRTSRDSSVKRSSSQGHASVRGRAVRARAASPSPTLGCRARSRS